MRLKSDQATAAINALAPFMVRAIMADDPKSQLDKFKQAARDHEADEDEARWDDRLKKVVKAKTAPEKPE